MQELISAYVVALEDSATKLTIQLIKTTPTSKPVKHIGRTEGHNPLLLGNNKPCLILPMSMDGVWLDRYKIFSMWLINL